jgi:hypothetical protein
VARRRGGVAAVVAAAIVLAGLPGGTPVTFDAAELAPAEAGEPAPASSGSTLRAAVDGLAFPDWTAEFGWHATGARRDELDGRATRTVFYQHMEHRIAYTIVSGPAVDVPKDARVVRHAGHEVALFGHDGNDVAVFERGGHTCVLSGRVEHTSTLVKLAAWRPPGAPR